MSYRLMILQSLCACMLLLVAAHVSSAQASSECDIRIAKTWAATTRSTFRSNASRNRIVRALINPQPRNVAPTTGLK